MKIVRENLYEFHKTGDPLGSLGLGYAQIVHSIFDECGVSRDQYRIGLGKRVVFDGYLDLTGCTGLTGLPDGLNVGGWLSLNGCTGLTRLPEGLSVGGSLDLNGCTGLTSLPDGLRVGEYLSLYGCTGLTMLPDGLNVGGWLGLVGCTGLTRLPDGLEVKDDICVSSNQRRLIDWIRASRFKDKLKIYQ